MKLGCQHCQRKDHNRKATLRSIGGLALQHYDKAGTGSVSPLEPSPTPCDIYCNLRQF